MITTLKLNNFKCFQDSPEFIFSKINLLTGLNGRGKSTLLQSILILAQSSWKYTDFASLAINDSFLQLGSFEDIKNTDVARNNSIDFSIKTDNPFLESVEFVYSENDTNPYLAKINALVVQSEGKKYILYSDGENNPSEYNSIIFGSIQALLSNVRYVSADRLGPIKYVDKITNTNFLHVGAKGEYTINVLANDNLPLVHDRLYRGEDAKTVKQQTEEWLNYILEGAAIDIRGKEQSSSILYMLLNNRKASSQKYMPINIGFGYSYALPLIVTGLIAQPGDIIIIENPEAHLHPRAQSKITEFFAKVASCGVQVFIESHSEHILNGLRVSALNPSIQLSPSEIAVQYFDEDFLSQKLDIDKKGKIANWPEGFFDQQEIDLSDIYKQSRHII